MASEEFGDKTHEATPHRRQKAREEGQVVRSQDLASAGLLVAGLLILWYFGQGVMEFFGRLASDQLGGEAWLAIDTQTAAHESAAIAWRMAIAVVPVLALVTLAAVLAQMGQFGFLYLPQKLVLDWQRLNPLQNAQRIFSLTSVVHLGFGLLKVGLIFAVAGWSLWGERGRLIGLTEHSSPEIAAYLLNVLFWTSLKIGGALAALALFDYGYQYWKHEQDLRMTTQELKEEIKTQQGDPQIAARRKQIQRQMVLHRLSSTIPKADAIVTNPTELAIALQYDPDKMAAPVVLAKGAGVLAQRIRRLGLENNVPIVERKELARALYANVEIGHPVPAELYAAVAEVIRYVYQLKGKKLPVARAA
ncbi:MAG TPA: EscU/YscU/HrcU family type III secretion system export apparatus switch protein [Pirellulaceae bacterium]|nr:EscU/YscU/HrcU family type III secretion system export apparatus switch protein [Pirellulaceae bacterium]